MATEIPADSRRQDIEQARSISLYDYSLIGSTEPLSCNLPQYIYSPLSSSYKHVRLLTLLPASKDPNSNVIECTISSSYLSGAAGYEALSYEWGSPERTRHILCNRKAMLVTENLWQALYHLRQSTPRTLWVDAICIDQENIPERNHQVLQMGEIYSLARMVLVWLGTGFGQSEPAIAALAAINQRSQWPRLFPKPMECDDRLWESWQPLTGLFGLSYWTRIWIIQEVLLARHLTLHCGRCSARWEDFADLCEYIMVGTDASNCRKTYKLTIKCVALNLANMTRKHTLEMQEVCCRSLCSDPRDKIYAIAGLAGECKDSVLEPGYSKSALHVYEDVMSFMEHKGAFGGCKRQRGDPFGIQISEIFLQYMFGGFTTEELDRLAIQHFRSRPGSSVDLFQVEGYSESSIVAVGPSLLEIIKDHEIARQWIKSIDQQSFESNFNDYAYFQVLTLLKSVQKPQEVKFSALKTVAFSSPQAYMVRAPPYGMRDIVEEKPLLHEQSQPGVNSKGSGGFHFEIADNQRLRLFYADDGHIGIAAGSIDIGDLVCTFSSSWVVAIVRLQGDRGSIIGRGVIDFNFFPRDWTKQSQPRKFSTWNFFLDIETLYFLTR